MVKIASEAAKKSIEILKNFLIFKLFWCKINKNPNTRCLKVG